MTGNPLRPDADGSSSGSREPPSPAIFLSPDRRRTTLSAGVCLILAGIAMLAVHRSQAIG
jgi:hypothetical protein